MTKPMYCPMTFGKYGKEMRIDDWNECTPDCAAAVFDFKQNCYACGLVRANNEEVVGNWRPLKDDAE